METREDLLITNVITVLPDGIRNDLSIGVSDGKISRMASSVEFDHCEFQNVLDGHGCYLSPGLIDTHTHGAIGKDFLDVFPDELEELLLWYASTGVTSLLPTLSAGLENEFFKNSHMLDDYRHNHFLGSIIAGIHIEGPYISEKRKGAQPLADPNTLSVEDADKYITAFSDAIRIVTLAPEFPNGEQLVKDLTSKDVIVSVGHSDATYEQVLAAVENGLTRSTHTFNAMSPLTHHYPGVIGAVIVCDEIFAELILDGYHIHPGAAKAMLKAKGLEKIVLVTDSNQATGLSDGVYIRPGDRKVNVIDGQVFLPTGQLAGSTLTLNKAVLNATKFLDLPLYKAVHLASLNPARSIGLLNVGQIKPGLQADLILHDKDLEISKTIKNGALIFSAEKEF